MDVVEEIKSRLSIEEVVGSYVQLKRAGRNFKACCPFHQEKTPSFIVSPDKGLAYCFGCRRGGDVIKFIQEVEKVDFPEALKILADRAGIDLPERTSSGLKKDEKARLFELNDEAVKFFQKRLKKDKAAQKYFKDREVDEETLETFRLGWAPDDFHETHKYLESLGFSKKELLKVGLAAQKSLANPEIYDRFRGRIIFPIFDARGRVVAFGGRTLRKDKETAK